MPAGVEEPGGAHVSVALLVAGVKARGVDFDPNGRIGDRVGDVDRAISDGEGAPHRREPEHVTALEGHVRLLGVDSIPASLRNLQDSVSCVRRGHLSVLSFEMATRSWVEDHVALKLLAVLIAFRLSICFAAAKARIGYACRSSISLSCRAFLGNCLRACRRTTSGTSSLPIPCPSNRGRTLRATVCRYPAVQSCRWQPP